MANNKATKIQAACREHNSLVLRISADAQTRYWTAFERESVASARARVLSMLDKFVEIAPGTWQNRTHGQVRLVGSPVSQFLFTPAAICVQRAKSAAFDAAKLDA